MATVVEMSLVVVVGEMETIKTVSNKKREKKILSTTYAGPNEHLALALKKSVVDVGCYLSEQWW